MTFLDKFLLKNSIPTERRPNSKCTIQWVSICPFNQHLYLGFEHYQHPSILTLALSWSIERSGLEMEVMRLDELIKGVATIAREKNLSEEFWETLDHNECHEHTTCEPLITYRIDFIGQNSISQPKKYQSTQHPHRSLFHRQDSGRRTLPL